MSRAEELWGKLLEGSPPVDESVTITSSDVNRQTAERMAALSPGEEMNLVEFLEARIAEDEAVAHKRPAEAHIHASGCYYYNWNLDANWYCDCDEDGTASARALADCTAKRAIMTSYKSCSEVERLGEDGLGPKLVASGMAKGLEIAIKCLAVPYASHPDWQEEWAK